MLTMKNLWMSRLIKVFIGCTSDGMFSEVKADMFSLRNTKNINTFWLKSVHYDYIIPDIKRMKTYELSTG